MDNSLSVKIIAFSIPFTLSACGGNSSTDDCKSSPREYSVTQYQGSSLEYPTPLNQATTTTIHTPIATNAVVPWQQFAIKLTADVQTYYVQLPTISLFTTANACSPSPGNARQNLSKISITSSRDFNAQHPAGTELASVFTALYQPFSSLVDIPVDSLHAPRELVIFLREAPNEGTQNFQVTITLSDTRSFRFTTGDIYLK